MFFAGGLFLRWWRSSSTSLPPLTTSALPATTSASSSMPAQVSFLRIYERDNCICRPHQTCPSTYLFSLSYIDNKEFCMQIVLVSLNIDFYELFYGSLIALLKTTSSLLSEWRSTHRRSSMNLRASSLPLNVPVRSSCSLKWDENYNVDLYSLINSEV